VGDFIKEPLLVKEDKSELIISHPAATLYKAADEKTISYIESSLKGFEQDMTSKVSEKNPIPFSLIFTDEKRQIFLPVNLEEYNRLLFRMIIKLCSDLKVVFSTTNQVIKLPA
jgi:hypothetical protein